MSILIKEMPGFMRPRERLLEYGVGALSDEELLAILLRTGTKKLSVKDLALNVLQKLDDITDLDNLTLSNLLELKGIGEAKAMSIIAALELGKRMYLKSDSKLKNRINNGADIYFLFKYLYYTEKQENLIVVLLDSKNNVIKSEIVFKGSLNISIAHPREIFRMAISHSANSIILVHNHPSGDPTPSSNDSQITKQMVNVGKIMGIPVIDHIIIGNNKYYTFKDNKMVMINEKKNI